MKQKKCDDVQLSAIFQEQHTAFLYILTYLGSP